jgi:hypothetical protein
MVFDCMSNHDATASEEKHCITSVAVSEACKAKAQALALHMVKYSS